MHSSPLTFFAASGLVSGTMIGGGMLALPLVTVDAGFFPTSVVFGICWLLMLFTGILLVDLKQITPQGASMLQIADFSFGSKGKKMIQALYFFLFYLLISLYFNALQGILLQYSGISSLVFRIAITAGTVALFFQLSPFKIVKTNFALVCGMLAALACFVILGIRESNAELLEKSQWSYTPQLFSIVFAAFAYQGSVPALVEQFGRNFSLCRLAVITGTFFTFVLYLIWEWLVLTLIPAPELIAIRDGGTEIVVALASRLSTESLEISGNIFILLAITTSLIGVTLGLHDFIASSLPKGPYRHRAAMLLTLAPPTFIIYFFPNLFIVALELAGGLGCAALLVVFPILAVWKAWTKGQLRSWYHHPVALLPALLLGIGVISKALLGLLLSALALSL